MINTVLGGGAVSDRPDRESQRDKPPPGRGRAPPDQGGDDPDAAAAAVISVGAPEHRLVVEHDEAKGVLTYRWVDRKTGAVVSELTREDLMKLRSDPAYQAGSWLNTKA